MSPNVVVTLVMLLAGASMVFIGVADDWVSKPVREAAFLLSAAAWFAFAASTWRKARRYD